MERPRVIIMGAAGRDFHLFNTNFRNNPDFEVVAFTATQIPFISDRTYPKELSGRLYPKGIKIYDESELPDLIKKLKVTVCILAYSDLSFNEVMEKASVINASGADFGLAAPEHQYLKSTKPVLAICAVRTGSGKTQTTRYVSSYLKKLGLRVVIIRHPMPYGNLKEQIVQRYASMKDLIKHKATIEEREDYEPHIRNGFILYAGVDYEKILRAAEKEADVIVWDGGNNDAPFIKPDLMITVADPLRAGHEVSYYPGEICARMADVLLINKTNSATPDQIAKVEANLKKMNETAKVYHADSIVRADNPKQITGKRVLIIEDGPTITHGQMPFGAGTIAAKQYHAARVVNAKQYATGTLKDTFQKYPQLNDELPAMGYSVKQIKDLEATVNKADCDTVISATPTDLRNVINANKPIVQVYYDLSPKEPGFDSTLAAFAGKMTKKKR